MHGHDLGVEWDQQNFEFIPSIIMRMEIKNKKYIYIFIPHVILCMHV